MSQPTEIQDLLPILQCPVSKEALSWNDSENTLVSKTNQFEYSGGVLALNPTPTDEKLNDYYEEVNANKPDLSGEKDAFAEIFDEVENYYRRSRLKTLKDLIPENLGLTLDIGGGSGDLFRSLLKRVNSKFDKLILVDWAKTQMRQVAPLFKGQPYYFVQADAMRLPFKDGTIDTIFNSEMIEHVQPEQSLEMLKEFNRKLKSGGHLIITTPNGGEYRRRIQEGVLTAAMLLSGKSPNDLMSREKVKSKLFRRYLKWTGHTVANIDAIEKAGYVGHFNVLYPNTLNDQLKEAGFEIVHNEYCIFIPLVVPGPFKKIRGLSKLLGFTENFSKAAHTEKLICASQMYLARKIG